MVEKSDMVFIYDISTAIVVPFVDVPTLTMIGYVMDIENPETSPLHSIPAMLQSASLHA